jgi:protein-S-isoprenylcysteine O-methyltransferase Ste14
VAGRGQVGLVLTVAGVGGVIRHRTTIVPHHPVAALITTGAYRWSRNPMYTGLAIAYLGGALLVGSWWPAAL